MLTRRFFATLLGVGAPSALLAAGTKAAARSADESLDEQFERGEKRRLTDKQKIQWLVDMKQIEMLQSRYSYARNLGSLFVDRDDTEVHVASKGRWLGRGAIQRWLGDGAFNRPPPPVPTGEAPRLMGRPGFMAIHMSVNPVIVIDPDRSSARGVWWSPGLASYPFSGKLEGVWSYGQYDNTYVPVGDGWRILKMKWKPMIVTPYDQGWHREVIDTNYDGSDRIKADAPAEAGFYHPYDPKEVGPWGVGAPGDILSDDRP